MAFDSTLRLEDTAGKEGTVMHNRGERTTMEMKAEHRARIHGKGAGRAAKGSGRCADVFQKALALKGSTPEKEAEGLSARTRKIRANWR